MFLPSLTISVVTIVLDTKLITIINIPLVHEDLFYKYFVRRLVGKAKKGRNVKI